MNILYVITGLGQGGAERVVCDLADSMHEKGHSVKIVYLIGDVLTKPVNSEIELIKVELNNLMTLPAAYSNLKNIIKDIQPDVVHAHMVHANILTRLVRLSTPIKKLICTAHNSNEGSFLRMALYRLTHNLADLTTNVSDIAVSSFEKKKAVPKNTMRTIYNGVNFKRFNYSPTAKYELFNELNLAKETKIILAVGRFNQQKNYPNLLNAIKLLRNEYQEPFVLLIAGDGELRLAIEKLINKLNLNKFIYLLGRRSDIPKLMSSCDVFVLSSDYEGLPTVLIEALACQAHAVSTDVSGAAEILKNNGVIVPINNSEKLFKAIQVSLNKNDKNKLGFNYVYETFNLDIICEKWLDIYYEK
ncbi:glycosyltransferase [Acinetobacter indicus]|uniref:glycosyltransferase n=1 Tax=Acinetobacter indicus TaxID=756892 RepID=UPI00148BA5BB|nr:glycosyltransferase [Acinetobacter indicus]NOJ68858.1 glycosyltransferase [Acinetobacter indicus]